jgi:ProP effector
MGSAGSSAGRRLGALAAPHRWLAVKPVDPAVHAIARLQQRFPLAFPKTPAPKVRVNIGIFEDLVPCAAGPLP